nr:sugar phosphate isomerase/epimerase family protein [Bacillus sp. FJAT-50079]
MYSLAATLNKENWSIIDFLYYAKSIGLDGVELLDFYWCNQEQEIKEVLAALKKYRLHVSAYDVTNNFVKGSTEERAEEVAKVEAGIQIAKRLGTRIVRVFCGDLHDNFTYEDGRDWIVEGLRSCARMAEQEQIYLAIENHGLLAGRSEQVEEIIHQVNSPYVKSTFDTGNFLLVHEEPQHAFDRLKNVIAHVHFKDFREKLPNESVNGFRSTHGVELIGAIPGDGQVDLAYIVNGLKSSAYDGWLSIEYEGDEDAKMANEEAVKRLRQLLI